jgi:hypothetical protein
VLPVTAAALAGAGEPAWRLDPVGRGRQDLHRVGTQELRGLLGHLDPDPLSRQRVPYEDDPALVPADAPATVGHAFNRDLHNPPDAVGDLTP